MDFASQTVPGLLSWNPLILVKSLHIIWSDTDRKSADEIYGFAILKLVAMDWNWMQMNKDKKDQYNA